MVYNVPVTLVYYIPFLYPGVLYTIFIPWCIIYHFYTLVYFIPFLYPGVLYTTASIVIYQYSYSITFHMTHIEAPLFLSGACIL
ncbi:hypothetical protein GDO81_007344 [Engystomops pustulosus]|uniref:Uncharacterized protein n=1 Tax=Engystomops pustulosus TaxID=76066 RepID=A0AAV7C6D5_ENGPU|nr:hypothetical protein GDO81_007344 [Engystomops pustulosus]